MATSSGLAPRRTGPFPRLSSRRARIRRRDRAADAAHPLVPGLGLPLGLSFLHHQRLPVGISSLLLVRIPLLLLTRWIRGGRAAPPPRRRRDASRWTLVQGLLAPFQFLVFLVSLVLVCRYLATGDGLVAANFSVVAKTIVLYAIMITGSVWERQVFGRWLFAKAFFWEDVFSMLVLALHTAYLVCLFKGLLNGQQLMILALAAVFLGERITPWMLMCAAVIVCGVALSTGLVRPGRRAAATASPPPPR